MRSHRTIAALVVLRDQVIDPILAGVRSPRQGRKPTHWTRLDRDYETIRVHVETLFTDLGITTTATAALPTFCRSGFRKRLVALVEADEVDQLHIGTCRSCCREVGIES